MTCKQVQAELVECWGRTEEVAPGVVEHLEVCIECRHEALLLRETRVLVHSLPQDRAPDGFTERILSELDREETSPGWLARLKEYFVPARRPAWARAAAVGVALALAVAGGAVWYTQAEEPAPQQIAAGPVIATPAATQATASEAELDELLVRHQTLEMTQPLADDAGVSLVVYTSN